MSSLNVQHVKALSLQVLNLSSLISNYTQKAACLHVIGKNDDVADLEVSLQLAYASIYISSLTELISAAR